MDHKPSKKIIQAFLGAAMGVVLAESALAQIVDAPTSEDRVRVLTSLIEGGDISAVAIDPQAGAPLVAQANVLPGKPPLDLSVNQRDTGFDRAGFDKSFDKDPVV